MELKLTASTPTDEFYIILLPGVQGSNVPFGGLDASRCTLVTPSRTLDNMSVKHSTLEQKLTQHLGAGTL